MGIILKVYMSRLILLRHAKSDWAAGSFSDFDRPVSVRGRRDLPVLARALTPFLDGDCHVLCSPALRARQTFELAKPFWPICKIDFIDMLYGCGIPELEQVVKGIKNKKACVIVIGHNPGLITFLCWCLSDSEITADCYNMQTSTAAVLDLPVVFSELKAGQARLTAYLRAKTLMQQNKEIE